LVILQWLATGIAVVVALAALLRARALARRLERLSESYWELRYEHGQLRSRIVRLEAPDAAARPAPEPTAAAPQTAFVPLSSLKR
jgi:hypothetical protein